MVAGLVGGGKIPSQMTFLWVIIESHDKRGGQQLSTQHLSYFMRKNGYIFARDALDEQRHSGVNFTSGSFGISNFLCCKNLSMQ